MGTDGRLSRAGGGGAGGAVLGRRLLDVDEASDVADDVRMGCGDSKSGAADADAVARFFSAAASLESFKLK